MKINAFCFINQTLYFFKVCNYHCDRIFRDITKKTWSKVGVYFCKEYGHMIIYFLIFLLVVSQNPKIKIFLITLCIETWISRLLFKILFDFFLKTILIWASNLQLFFYTLVYRSGNKKHKYIYIRCCVFIYQLFITTFFFPYSFFIISDSLATYVLVFDWISRN